MAKSTHAGIPWLRYFRERLGKRLHIWRADRNGSLAAFLKPELSPLERTLAKIEGWISGVPGLIRAGKGCDDSAKSPTCDPRVFRLR